MERRAVHPQPAGALSDGRRRLLAGAAVAGALVCAVGALVAPERTWANLLVAALLVLGFALGGLLFVAFGYVTRAGWHVAFRRVPEAFAATLPAAAACTLVALAGLPLLYEWAHPEVVAGDALLQAKRAWLAPVPFLARAVLFLGLWLLFARLLVRTSRRQDATGAVAATSRNVVLSAGFLVVFAVTFSLASFDWIMSLEPHWYSTVFAAYHFSGLFLGSLGALTLACVWLRRAGPFRGIFTDDHLHDLGKLTLGFATFWGYLWYCQYMLIWYGNLPEETAYFALRQQGAWGPLTFLNPLVGWLVPFLALLPRATKRSESWMVGIALLLVAGRWLDLYLMILPPFSPQAPPLGPVEVAAPVLALALTALLFVRALRRAPLVAGRDPMLQESLHHRT